MTNKGRARRNSQRARSVFMFLFSLIKMAVRALRALGSARALRFSSKYKRLGVAHASARFFFEKGVAAPALSGGRLPVHERMLANAQL